MTESDRQDGVVPAQGSENDVIPIAAVLNNTDDQDLALPPLREQDGGIIDPDTLIEAPLETAAGPGTPADSGGGSFQYSSDFGELIARPLASGGDGPQSGSATPQGFFATAFIDDDPFVPPPSTATPTATPVVFVAPVNPVGPGAGAALFTKKADSIDLNGIDVDGHLDGTQYDAGKGHDMVQLPSTPIETLEAGFTTGTLFQAGNGNDTVTGGDLADLIDGGSGHDSLSGGAGNDVLSGGSGKDVFTYALSADEGHDLILDFKTGNGGDRLEIADLIDVDGDSVIDLADLDAGGHSVSGSADAIVITFESGTSITLDGLNGAGIDSFADLVANAKVNIDIL